MPTAALFLLSTLTLAAPPQPAVTASPAPKPTTLQHCVVTLIDQVQVPAREAGVLTAIAVQEGMQVKTGDLLAQLDDVEAKAKLKVAELEHRVAQEQAESDVRVQAMQAESEVTETEFLRGSDLQNPASSDDSQMQLRRLLLAPERAKLQTDVARLDLRIAQLSSQVRAAQVDAAEQSVARRRIVTPLDGVVVQLYRHAGEWVNPGEPILHVVRMDRLRVEGFLRADLYSPDEVLGREVDVAVTLPRGRVEHVPSKITFASPLVETSGQYRVWAEFDNRFLNGHWLFRPGLRADMTGTFGK